MVGLPGRGGLANHRALHPRWEAQHRPVAEEFMAAAVLIQRHSSDGTFNETTGRTTYPDPTEVWTGWARLQRRAQQQGDREIGDRQVVVGNATLSIPASANEVQIGDEVQVRGYRDPDSGDPYLAGRPLWVHEVRPGSVLWERDLVIYDAPPTSR